MATSTGRKKTSTGFTDVERAAMKARALEARAEARSKKSRKDGENAVLAAIAAMPKSDGAMAKRIDAIVKKAAPELFPKTWYGMPAYARDGKVVCFFQSGHKFDARYSTFGFQPEANLDAGNMWPTTYALKKLTAADEKKIATLVKKAVR